MAVLPRQVQKQVDDAKRIQDQMKRQADGEPPVPPDDTPPVDQSTPPADPPPDVPPIDPPPNPEAGLWEQRYNVLQSKYDAEVPRLFAQVRELTEQLRTAVAPAPAVAPAQTAPTTLVTSADVEQFGPEIIDLIGRKAQEIAGAQVDTLMDHIKKLEQALGGVSSRQGVSDRDRFFMELDKLVPTWRKTNENSQFNAWLAQVEPMIGFPRKVALDDAVENNDAHRAAFFFTAFAETLTPVSPAQPVPQVPTLENQVSPTKPGGGATPPGGAAVGRIFKRSDVSKFYSDVARGVYKNRDAEKVALEREMYAARSEGRIVEG